MPNSVAEADQTNQTAVIAAYLAAISSRATDLADHTERCHLATQCSHGRYLSLFASTTMRVRPTATDSPVPRWPDAAAAKKRQDKKEAPP